MMQVRGKMIAAVLIFAAHGAQAAIEARDVDNNPLNGYEAYYDSAQHVTWIADANLFATQLNALAADEQESWVQAIIAATPVVAGHSVTPHDFSFRFPGAGSNGVMTWWGAHAYANSAAYFGRTGWRLPSMVDFGDDGCNLAYQGTDCGWNVDAQQAELAHMHRVGLQLRSAFGPNGEQGPGNVIPYGSSLSVPGIPDGFVVNMTGDSYWYGTSYAVDSASAWTFNFSSGLQIDRAKFGGSAIMRTWLVGDGDVFASPIPEPAAGMLGLSGLLLVLFLAARNRSLASIPAPAAD